MTGISGLVLSCPEKRKKEMKQKVRGEFLTEVELRKIGLGKMQKNYCGVQGKGTTR